jgi:hypothetical protein
VWNLWCSRHKRHLDTGYDGWTVSHELSYMPHYGHTTKCDLCKYKCTSHICFAPWFCINKCGTLEEHSMGNLSLNISYRNHVTVMGAIESAYRLFHILKVNGDVVAECPEEPVVLRPAPPPQSPRHQSLRLHSTPPPRLGGPPVVTTQQFCFNQLPASFGMHSYRGHSIKSELSYNSGPCLFTD